MNYLSISINFARQIPMLNPTTGEIALFHALLDLKNIDMNFKDKTGKKKSWADGFDPTSATLQLYSGLSANGIVKAREKLKALGLIDFKSRGRRKSTVYKLLDLSSDKSAFNSSVNSSDNSSDISGDNSSDNSVPLNKTKQDKTKQNNKVLSDARDEKSISDVFNLWESNWGFPNGIAQQDLTEWTNQFGADLVIHAITFALRRNINSKGADRYLARTFERYQQEGITTVEQAEKRENQHQQQASREYGARSFNKPKRREPIPEWMRKDLEDKSKQNPDPRIQHGYVMPDDSMDPIPK
ncbi:DnaD domain protein [Limosilactobacillus portuensis]|uniref:DnaD domain protein n=1 Tax=Limosilactobacillus portuensis TaxID=2742601 RepID=UPI002359F553|nr:DnaD domain protein [Limosilactobacillus portuensis]WCT60211.1 DnaD domain protein [Limosilactobacillus portuensis]WCT60435.1 DnaD domain protein [Limosilactobacillus portuensis]